MSRTTSDRSPSGLRAPLVMMVTDRSRSGDSGRAACAAVVAASRRAATAGVDVVQLRERGLNDADLLTLATDVATALSATAARIVINDRLDVAVAAGASGVHLPGDSAAASRYRALALAGLLIGRSVHSVGEAVAAEDDGGCDYLIFGTVFDSESKPQGHAAAGAAALADVCAAVRLPVLAIGGITVDRVPQIVEAGAAGVAAIGLFATAGEGELHETVERIRAAFAGR